MRTRISHVVIFKGIFCPHNVRFTRTHKRTFTEGQSSSLPVRQEEQRFFLSECEIRGLSDSFGIQESPSTSGTDWSIIGPYRM